MGVVLHALLDLLVGWTCPCGVRGAGCPCPRCDARARSAPRLDGAVDVDGAPVGALVRAVKFGSWPGGARWLARRLLERAPPPGDIVAVTWVPADRRRALRRGIDLPRSVARRVARELRVPAVALLQRTASRPQRGLDSHERIDNARASFDVHPRAADRVRALPAAGGTILLVDDVCTTGATLRACTALLRVALRRRADIGVAAVALIAVPPPDTRDVGVSNSRSLRRFPIQDANHSCR